MNAKAKSEHPKIVMIVQRPGLVPASEYDAERLTRYGYGSRVTVDLRQERSIPQHRLYWVILGVVAENNDVWRTAEAVHRNIKIALGYVESYTDFFGEVRETEVSTSFASMDQAAFKEYFDLALELIRLHFKIDTDKLIAEGKRRLIPQRHVGSRHEDVLAFPTNREKTNVQGFDRNGRRSDGGHQSDSSDGRPDRAA